MRPKPHRGRVGWFRWGFDSLRESRPTLQGTAAKLFKPR